jgi:hypothetical protein
MKFRSVVVAGCMVTALGACAGSGEAPDAASTQPNATEETFDSGPSLAAPPAPTTTTPAREITTTPVDPGPPVPISSTSVADTHGISPIGVPMELADVRARTGAEVARNPASENPCAVIPVPDTDGVSLWLDGTVVFAIDVSGPTIRTDAGVGVGSSEAEVFEAYGQRVSSDTGRLGHRRLHVIDPESSDYGLTFLLDGDEVTSYRVGHENVRLLWDCS